MPEAALCSRCGAPAKVGASACPFCGTAFRNAPAPTVSADREKEILNFIGALQIEGMTIPEALLRVFPGDPAARAAGRLIQEFERAEKVKLEAVAAIRLLNAYRKARQSDGVMNLPFLTANASGPVHFNRELTQADVA